MTKEQMRIMKLFNVILKLSALFVGLASASGPPLHLNRNTQRLTSIREPPVLNNKRYPDSYFIRTAGTPQTFCGNYENLTVATNNMDHNVTIRNCEALRDMYATDSTADGNGYWNFTFAASDLNNTSGLPQFTVDFDGDCELKMGLVDYSKVPLNVEIGNTDVYNLINAAIGGGNFSVTTGQVGCNDNVQVVWAVQWISGSIGR